MTTFNLRVDPNGEDANDQAEERVRTLVIGSAPAPLPKLHISSRKEEVEKIDVDVAPANVGIQRQSARGVVRGAQRGAF